MRPRLALVPGEPAGIGPELCVRLAQAGHPADLVAIADPDTLLGAARALGLPLRLRPADQTAGIGELALLPMPQAQPTRFGELEPANARSVIDGLLRAGSGCLAGEFDGVVTGPVHKANVNAAGIAYTGTTELLAAQAGTPVVMMLAGPKMRVALATTHLPLRQVPDAITEARLAGVLEILHESLRHDFGIAAPRIGVLGLNPHAGEDGLLGQEERQVIIPVLDALRARGMDLVGPLPADTGFLPAVLAGLDAILAMYHDQGLPVLKHVCFEQAVNITLGLPYPRVAVDHGTALPLAGRGVADVSSLVAAVACCAQMASTRKAGA